MILGLAGFTIALERGVEIIGLSPYFFLFFLYLTVVIFLFLIFAYGSKMVNYFDEVKKDFNSPIKINFFPTFSISFLLLSIAFLSVNPVLSKYLWILGTIFHFLFTLVIISVWIRHEKFKINHMNPSWFIPAVGNILVPVAGVAYFSSEISWFFFAVGLFFWIILLVIFFNRIFFHDPLPEKLLPTLFILIAPPAVGFISYFKLTGVINDFSRILYYFALFLTLLVLTQIKMFSRIKYYLSWWAYLFPLASMSIASALMYHITKYLFFKFIYIFLLLLLALLLFLLAYKTIQAMLKQKICVEED
jgi:tellurite resistance protein